MKTSTRSRFTRNGYHTTSNSEFNTQKPPYGYNYALGYCEQGTEEVITKNHSKNVYMDTCSISSNPSIPKTINK